MAFALNKSSEARPETRKPSKRSPLAGWLGKKAGSEANNDLPEVDVAGGLNRALRNASQAAPEKPAEKKKTNPAHDALAAIEAALYAIDRIRDSLEQACEVTLSAKDVEDVGGRALLAERFDEWRLSIDAIIENVDPRAVPLIGKNQRHLDVTLGGKARYSVSPVRLDVSEKGLNVSPPRDAFATYEEIDATLEELDNALARADRAAAGYCRDAQYLIARTNAEAEG